MPEAFIVIWLIVRKREDPVSTRPYSTRPLTSPGA